MKPYLKQDFVNFTVMNGWTKRQLFRQFLYLVAADWQRQYRPIRRRIRYIVMGL